MIQKSFMYKQKKVNDSLVLLIYGSKCRLNWGNSICRKIPTLRIRAFLATIPGAQIFSSQNRNGAARRAGLSELIIMNYDGKVATLLLLIVKKKSTEKTEERKVTESLNKLDSSVGELSFTCLWAEADGEDVLGAVLQLTAFSL